MSKTLIKRVKLALVLIMCAISFMFVGICAFNDADAQTNIEGLWDVKTFQMEDARLLVEGDDGVNGLEFVASMSADEFEGFTSLVGEGKMYEYFRTNLIIMPKYYTDEVGMPGDMYFEGTFDWAEYDELLGEYVYEESDKIRVININANDWVLEGDKYVYTGAIVDVLEQNESMEFLSFAYIEALNTNDWGYNTTWTVSGRESTDPKAYSVTSIPEEIAEEFSSLTKEQQAWITKNWVTVSMVEDTTEYLIDVKDQKKFDLLDAVKDKDAIDHLNSFTGMPFTLKATDVNGNVKTDRILDVTESDSLRLWDLEIYLGEDIVYKGKVDLYNSEESAVWNEMNATSGVENALLIRDEDSKVDGKMNIATYDGSYEIVDGKPVIKAHTKTRNFYITVLPLHSKAYYEAYQDGDYTFSYNWKYTSEGTINLSSQGFYFINGTAWNGSNRIDTWYSNNITLKQIVDNWDNFTNFPTREWGTRYMTGMFCAYNFVTSNHPVDIFVNFSLVDNAAVNTLFDVSKVEDKTSVDLSTVINKGIYSNLVNGYPNATWSLVDIDGTKIAITDKNSFDVSAIAEKNYKLVVEDGEVKAFEADFDIYDSTKPLVWNTVSEDTLDYVKTYQFINANLGVGELKDNVIVDTNGYFKATSNEFYYYHDGSAAVSPIEYFSIKLLPLHSKAYYQQYYGKGLVIRMEIIKEGLSDYSIAQFMGADYHYAWATKYASVTIQLDKLIENWIAYNGTGMTTNGDAWTFMTRASTNNADQQFVISFGDITITQPATETTGVGSLKGKQVTVIGDSITTWNLNPDGACYPHSPAKDPYNIEFSVNDTWWKQVLNYYGMELVANKATSGATAGHGVLLQGKPTSNSKLNVCNSSTALSKEGVNPDMVFVYLGVNDISRGSTVLKDGDDYTTQAFYDMIPGLYKEYNEKYSSNTADYGMNLSISLGLDTYARAYAYILYSIKHNYPNAEIVCLNVPEINSRAREYNDVVSVVAEYYGAIVVDNNGAFKSAGGSYASHTYDNSLHPDKEGFDIMSNAVIAKLNEVYGN